MSLRNRGRKRKRPGRHGPRAAYPLDSRPAKSHDPQLSSEKIPRSDDDPMTQADFLQAPFPPARVLPDGPPEGPARFFNRELSWLSFNWRVLDEARNLRVPLLERLRFLSISAANLDEFFTVRVAGLRELVREGNATVSDDGLSPAEQLGLINADARRLMAAQQSVWNTLRREMEAAGIVIVTRQTVTSEEVEWLDRYFLDQVFPVVSPLAIDPADPASIEAAFGKIVATHGRLDVLVNNAGIGINAPFVDFKLAEFELSLRINLTGAFLCGQAAARQMLTQKSGKIINIVSLSGQRGGMGRAGYGASKAGLELLTKVMAVELAAHGINVNAIAPGPIDTELSRVVHAAGGTRDAYLFLTPQRRYGDPDEIAHAAVFLASDQSAYVNGHVLNVDGGFGAAGLMYPLPQPTS